MASDAKTDGAGNNKISGLIKVLDEGLKRYYLKHNRPYDSLLANWFDENDFKEPMNVESFVDGSSLLAFLDQTDNFPFDSSVTDDMKREEFLKILRQILDDPECFSLILPSYVQRWTVDENMFRSVTQEDISKTKEQYQKQVPIFCNKHVLTDKTLLTILTVGHKHGFNYLGHLSDWYTRERIQHMVKSKQTSRLTVKQWANPQSHRHFKQLADVKVEMFNVRLVAIPYHELVSRAIISYQKRICKRLDLAPPIKINNSIEIVADHFSAACQFVRGRLSKFKGKPKPCCPFQVDVCIAVGAPLPAEEESDDDEYDGDDDQKKDPDEFIDCIGDIDSRLKANKLNFEAFDVGNGDDGTLSRARVWRDGYKNLMGTDRDDEQFLRHQRLISFVDRRNNEKETERVFVYKPPNTHSSGGNPLDIPKNAVNEWFLASSAMTVLPGIHFSTEKEVPPSESHPATEVNIGAWTGIEGGLLTLSIHVLEEDLIRAYLYWNGGVMRFMPEDIRDVFPLIFNMDFKGNREYKNREGLHRNMNLMKLTLKDRKFEHFRNGTDMRFRSIIEFDPVLVMETAHPIQTKPNLIPKRIATDTTSLDNDNETDITKCPSSRFLVELFSNMKRLKLTATMYRDIISDLMEQQHDKQSITTSMKDVVLRCKWGNGAKHQVMLHHDEWRVAELTHIEIKDLMMDNQVMVRVDGEELRMKQFSADLRPTDANDPNYLANYQFKADIMKYVVRTMEEEKEFDPFDLKYITIKDAMDTLRSEYQYSVHEILDHIHYLKYGQKFRVDSDDKAFAELFKFLMDAMDGEMCNVNDCVFLQCYHRDEEDTNHPCNLLDIYNTKDYGASLLFHTFCSVHSYFLFSYKTDRLTPEEKDKIRATEDSESKREHDTDDVVDDDTDDANQRKEDVLREILKKKREELPIKRRQRPFADYDDSTVTQSDDTVDLRPILRQVSCDENALQKVLGGSKVEKQRLISKLIDVVYDKQRNGNDMWKALDMDDDRKDHIFRFILYKYFKNTDLNNRNFVKLSEFIISRQQLSIDVHAFQSIVFKLNIDGRIFDAMNPRSYQNAGQFLKHFKSIPNIGKREVPDIQRLYTVMKEWDFVENKVQKQAVKESKEVKTELLDTARIEVDHETQDDEKEDFEMVNMVIEAMDQLKTEKPKMKSKFEEFQDQIIEYFRETESMDIDTVINMKKKEFSKNIATHCDSTAVRGVAGHLWTKLKMMSQSESMDAITEPLDTAQIEFQKPSTTTETEIKTQPLKVYATGKRYNFWNDHEHRDQFDTDYIAPRYGSMKEEVLAMADMAVFNMFDLKEAWIQSAVKANEYMMTNTTKKMVSNGQSFNIYKIPKGMPITKEHVLALILYTDITKLCNQWIYILLIGELSEISKIHHLTKLLTECVQCFGFNLDDEAYRKKKYYRGLSDVYIFENIVSEFNLPTSTSIKAIQALQFNEDSQGILITLKHFDDSYNVKMFDCKRFSCHPEESEMLFFGGNTVMKITQITQHIQGRWMKYAKFLQPIDALFRMMRNQSIKDHLIRNKTVWQERKRNIMEHVLRSTNLERKEGDIPDYIYKMVMHQHCKSSVTLIYSELLSHYEWLHDIFHKNSDDDSEDEQLDITNICIYFSLCDGVSFLINQEMKESECRSFVKDLKELAKLGWNSVITLIWKDSVPQFVSKILKSDCKNECSMRFEEKEICLDLMQNEGQPQSRIDFIIDKLADVDSAK